MKDPRRLKSRWKLHKPPPGAKPHLQLKYRAINLNDQLKDCWTGVLYSRISIRYYTETGKKGRCRKCWPLQQGVQSDKLEGYFSYKIFLLEEWCLNPMLELQSRVLRQLRRRSCIASGSENQWGQCPLRIFLRGKKNKQYIEIALTFYFFLFFVDWIKLMNNFMSKCS